MQGQTARFLLGGDILESHQRHLVRTEAIALHKERDEDALHVNHQVVGLNTVEDIVGEEKLHLALQSVGLDNKDELEDYISA